MHPAFILLVHALQAEDRPFTVTAVQAIPSGFDTLDVVRRWLLRSWERLRVKASDDAVLAHAEVIAALHRAALAGETIEPARWRAARRPPASAGGNISTAVAGAMAACAWDLQTVPGAAADFVQALGQVTKAAAEVSIGWTEEHTARERQYQADTMAAGWAGAGKQPEGRDKDWHATEAGQAWHRAFDAGREAFRQTHPYDLPDRWAPIGEATKAALALAREDLLVELSETHCFV
jgi:hypothetical protein